MTSCHLMLIGIQTILKNENLSPNTITFFWYFLKFWFFGNFTLCIQSHLLPSPSMSALYPCRFLQNRANKKKKPKITFHCSVFQPLHHIILCHRGLGSYHVSHSISLYLNSFTCKCSLRWVVGLAQGLWLLVNH